MAPNLIGIGNQKISDGLFDADFDQGWWIPVSIAKLTFKYHTTRAVLIFSAFSRSPSRLQFHRAEP